MTLPACFCWSRFGTEAGQAIEQIFQRKEQERVANAGLFFWGIGNAIGPSIRELLRRAQKPEVLFSPIRSTPRLKDSWPPAVVAWTSAETLEGTSFALPHQSLVTSRHDPLAPKAAHYALVCFSEEPLELSRCDGIIAFACVRNLLTGRPVASSQVTAVVEHRLTCASGVPTYDVVVRTRLVYPYFLRLRNPLLLASADSPGSNFSTVVRQVWDRWRSTDSR
jgi:hypothetical protein